MGCVVSSSSTLLLLSNQNVASAGQADKIVGRHVYLLPLGSKQSHTQSFLGEHHVCKCTGQKESAPWSKSFVMSQVGVLD